jgi:hypothetical protein
MLFWIIQSTVVSVIFIFLIHTLYEYFKQMYSTPKIKDLVNGCTYDGMIWEGLKNPKSLISSLQSLNS